MILEVAILDVKPNREKEFEISFKEAKGIIKNMKGFISLELQKCMETQNRYILLVNWKTLEDHTDGFRKSDEYKNWKKLLHDFYDPFPIVEHYEKVFSE